MSNNDQQLSEVDTPLESTVDPTDLHMDSEFGTLNDLIAMRPEMSVLYIPGIGKKFYIRTLTGQEVDVWRTSITIGKGQNTTVNQKGMRAKLAVLALGNPDGSRMLSDKDIPMVQAWPSRILELIFDRTRKFNALTEEDTDVEQGNL